MGNRDVELTPTTEELLDELAVSFERRRERHDDEVTVEMVYQRARAKGSAVSRETIRVGLKAKAEAGELVVRKIGTHAYYSKPK